MLREDHPQEEFLLPGLSSWISGPEVKPNLTRFRRSPAFIPFLRILGKKPPRDWQFRCSPRSELSIARCVL